TGSRRVAPTTSSSGPTGRRRWPTGSRPGRWSMPCATRFATGLAEDGASATEIQALLGHESLNTSQGYIDATASATRQAARANRTYQTLQQLAFSTTESSFEAIGGP